MSPKLSHMMTPAEMLKYAAHMRGQPGEGQLRERARVVEYLRSLGMEKVADSIAKGEHLLRKR